MDVASRVQRVTVTRQIALIASRQTPMAFATVDAVELPRWLPRPTEGREQSLASTFASSTGITAELLVLIGSLKIEDSHPRVGFGRWATAPMAMDAARTDLLEAHSLTSPTGSQSMARFPMDVNSTTFAAFGIA